MYYKFADEIEFSSVDPDDLGELSDKHEVVAVYIIHAMPLSGRRLKQFARIRRRQI
jgi:hypothetical protein